MPVIEDIQLSSAARIIVWEIKETIDFLKSKLDLTDFSKKILLKKKSAIHQKQFLTVRNILKLLSIHDSDLNYDVDGKPFIKSGYISISHAKEFVAVLISDEKVGVDIESNSDKCFRIKQKFIGTENEFTQDYYVNYFINKNYSLAYIIDK